MEIYYFRTNGEKVGPVTKKEFSKLVESCVIIESTKLLVNGKQYIAGQIPMIAQLINRQKASPYNPPPPPMPGDKQTLNSHGQASKPNSSARVISHSYAAASNYGFAPELKTKSLRNSDQRNSYNTSNTVYTKFWKCLDISGNILKFFCTLALIISVFMFCLRLFQASNGNAEDLEVNIWLLMIIIIGIVLVFSNLILSFMAAIVQSAEESQISRSILEKIANKILAEEADTSETTTSSSTGND